MQRSKWVYRLIALFVVFVSLTAFVGEFDDEKDLIKTADKHFKSGRYKQCLDLYSTLVANHPQDPNFNYKYGACLLIATENKEKALSYLNFATQKEGAVDPVAFYYFGKALQLNYAFNAASKQYIKFKSLGKPKDVKSRQISALIAQCETANKLISNFKKMDVVTKKSVGETEFFRSYRLGSMKRNIIVTPDEFLVGADKKSNDYSLIVHNPTIETIYLASYNALGSVGGKDIFKILKMPDGTFSDPVNLGPLVNSPLDEDYPYLHPNGRLLYFASKGHNSIGGYDIFRSKLDTNTSLWGKAENVGFSVNSPADDILYVSDMDENIAYFSSNRSDAQGNMTVYKILPNTSLVPVVLVSGQVEIEGSRNNTAKITLYNSRGEELAKYNAYQTGNFVMTLDENETYTIGVSAPGRGESKSQLIVPFKKESPMLSKKFSIGSGKMIVGEGVELATEEAKNTLLRESAMLNVNQAKDVDFNTEIERPKSSKPTPKPIASEKDKNNESDVPLKEDLDEELSVEDNILAEAEQELQEIITQKENLEKQVNAAYTVANKKKIKADLNRYDVEQLSGEYESVIKDEEKKEVNEKLENKMTELKANTASATSAIEFAKSKEREFSVKEKQEELAKTYLNAVKKAKASNNSGRAIKDLELARDQLEKIQEEIKRVQENDGSEETFAKADAAKKKVADFELKKQMLEKDLEDVSVQQINLQEQSDATRNKGMKEEFALQIKELDDELAEIKIEAKVNHAYLTAAKSEYQVLSSQQNMYDEVYTEADGESNQPKSIAQKQSIQRDVEVQNKKMDEILSVNGQKQLAERNKVELEQEDFVKGREIEENSPIKTVDEENSIQNIKNTFNRLDEEAKVSPKDQYTAEIAKARLERETLKTIQEEIGILEVVQLGTKDKRQKKELETKLKQLKVDAEISVENLREYVNNAQIKEKEFPEVLKVENQESVDLLAELTKDVSIFEKEIESALNLPKTDPLSFDFESASDNEIDELLTGNGGFVQSDMSFDRNNKEVKELIVESDALRESASKDLILANKEQISYESKGGEGRSLDAEKLEKSALDKQLNRSELIGKAAEIQYLSKIDALKVEIQKLPSLLTPELEDFKTELNDQWNVASLLREQSNLAGNNKDKIRLLNEAKVFEEEILVKQEELLLKIAERKKYLIASSNLDREEVSTQVKEDIEKERESDKLANKGTGNSSNLLDEALRSIAEVASEPLDDAQGGLTEETNFDAPIETNQNEREASFKKEEELAKSELNEIENVKEVIESKENEIGATETEKVFVIKNSKEIISVDPQDFNVNQPSAMAVKYANKKGYGIEREHDLSYGGTAAVLQAKEKSENLEKLALDYFYKAETLKQNAEDNPANSKKILKDITKLMSKGQKAQDKANDAYADLNTKELDYNAREIELGLEYNEIQRKDSARQILAESLELVREAQALRSKANKAKNEEKYSLINQAYAKEVEAIRKQNFVLSGALDEEEDENEEEEDEVLVNNSVPTPSLENNEYVRKALKLRAEADEEEDPEKKRALFEEANKYQQAGNTSRNKRILGALTSDKLMFESNREIVQTFRSQSKRNLAANDAWRYEQKADSLFFIADDLRAKAVLNEDIIARLEQIEEANELLAEAKEIQGFSINKYQESKSSKEEEGIVMLFGENKTGSDFVSNSEKLKNSNAEEQLTSKVDARFQSEIDEIGQTDDSDENSGSNEESESDLVLNSETSKYSNAAGQINSDSSIPLKEGINENLAGIDESDNSNTDYDNLNQSPNVENAVADLDRGTRVSKNTENKTADLEKDTSMPADIENKEKDELSLGEIKNVSSETEENEINQAYELTNKKEVFSKEATNIEVREFPQEILTGSDNIEPPEVVYKSLIKEADEAEASEVERVERIIQLKMDAAADRTKSEELLAKVDGLSDEAAIMNKINAANKFRASAEEKEVDAKNQEFILKNNVAEARQKRKEAQMILAAMDSDKQTQIFTESKSSDSSLEKVRQFLNEEESVDGIDSKNRIESIAQNIELNVESNKNESTDFSAVNSDGPKKYVAEYSTVQTEKQVTEISLKSDSVVSESNTGVQKDGLYVSNDSREEEGGFEGDGPLIPVNLNDDTDVEIETGKMSLLNEGGTEGSVDVDFVVGANKVYRSDSKIPLNTQMPNGLIYQVQVGAFRKKIDPTIFNGLSPLVGEKTTSGIVRYKVGYFRGFKSANMAKGRIRKLGFPDAFVVIFYNGNRITLDKANEIFDAANEGEKFVYENLIEDEVQNLRELGIEENEAEYVSNESEKNVPFVLTPLAMSQASNENGLDNNLLSINGLFYTVQVGVFRNPRISSDLSGVMPLYTERLSNGYLRYTTGVYRDYETADERKGSVRQKGIKDAYVTAYKDNKRISASQARNEQEDEVSENSNVKKQSESLSTKIEVVFKVQVGAYRAPINVETNPVFQNILDYGISNLKTSNGILIYMVGSFKTKSEADNLRKVINNTGGQGCFVVALLNGERIPIQKALEISE